MTKANITIGCVLYILGVLHFITFEIHYRGGGSPLDTTLLETLEMENGNSIYVIRK